MFLPGHLFIYNLTIRSCLFIRLRRNTASSSLVVFIIHTPAWCIQVFYVPIPHRSYSQIINKYGSKHRQVEMTWGHIKSDMRQYNSYGNGGGYGQSNPYGTNSGYDTPPTYSTYTRSPRPRWLPTHRVSLCREARTPTAESHRH